MVRFSVVICFVVRSIIVLAQDSVYFEISQIDSSARWKVSLSSKQEGKIFYSLDGSVPNRRGHFYRKPFRVGDLSVIRARLRYKKQWGEVYSRSIIQDRKYSLPIVSICVEPKKFFGHSSGIYSKGCCADSVSPYRGANFWKDIEVPANFEYILKNGESVINQKVGVKIFGGYSRSLPQKSLSIIARNMYGSNKLNYRFFKERKHKKYKSVVLRNSGGDFCHTHFRDAFTTHLVRDIGLDIQAYQPVVAFINGEYWGILNMREKINEHYLHYNHDVHRDSIDLLKRRNELKVGTRTHYFQMMKFIGTTDLSVNKNIRELNAMMDIDNYLDYHISQVYIDNRDAGGNVRFWRPTSEGGRWKWILFDTDFGFGISDRKAYISNTLADMTEMSDEAWPNPNWSTFIIRNLLKNDSIREEYVNRFSHYLNTIFHPNQVIPLIDSIQNGIREEIPYHFDRWRSSMEKWEDKVEGLRKYARLRPKYMRKFLAKKFNLGGMLKVRVNYDPTRGSVLINDRIVDSGYSGLYFEEVGMHLAAKVNYNFVFPGWNETLGISDDRYTPTTHAVLNPEFGLKPQSRHSDSVVFSEICFKQDSAHDTDDWFELQNKSGQSIDLSGWHVTSRKNKYFYFPDRLKIAPQAFLVVCRDTAKFRAYYGDTIAQFIGDMDFGLNGWKDKIGLYDNIGLLVDTLTYVYDTTLWGAPERYRAMEVTYPWLSNDSLKNWTIAMKKSSPGDFSYRLRELLYQESKKRNGLLKIGVVLLVAGVLAAIIVLIMRKNRKPID